MVEYRWAERADYEALGEVMYDAVRNGPSRYDEAQRAAWVPAPRKGEDWNARLAAQDVVVAEEAGRIVGFMSLQRDDAYLDFAYIRPEAQGSGLFRAMLEKIVERGRDLGAERITVHASLMAQPAFSAHGFDITEEETVAIGEQQFRRFAMERVL